MQLTLFTDYSLRMLMYLGLRPKSVVPVGEIADAHAVSHHYMLKVAQELSRLGHIEAVRGRKGGVRLNAEPAAVSLGELARLTEPEGPVLDCLRETGPSVECAILPSCRLRGIVGEAEAAFYAVLDSHTLADLLVDPGALGSLLKIHPS